jgi:hypothetical protein
MSLFTAHLVGRAKSSFKSVLEARMEQRRHSSTVGAVNPMHTLPEVGPDDEDFDGDECINIPHSVSSPSLLNEDARTTRRMSQDRIRFVYYLADYPTRRLNCFESWIQPQLIVCLSCSFLLFLMSLT